MLKVSIKKFILIFLFFSISIADNQNNIYAHNETVLNHSNNNNTSIYNQLVKQRLDGRNNRQFLWPTIQDDNQKVGSFEQDNLSNDPKPPALPPFAIQPPLVEPPLENEQTHTNSDHPIPPDGDLSINSKQDNEPHRVETVSVREFCASGQENIQLGPCSATYIHCMDFATTFEFKDSPLESVFIQGSFRKAVEVPVCLDSEINRLNEATEKLAISVNFCDQGPGVYRAPLQNGGDCSRQALLCDKLREPLSISCSSNQVLDSHTLQCVPAPDHCLFVSNQVYAPIQQFLMEIYCTFKPIEISATNSDSDAIPFVSSASGHGPLPVCEDWFVTCAVEPLKFGFCESGKVFDASRQLCRAMLAEDRCSNIGACRGSEWQKVPFGQCRQEFGYCDGARPRVFTCQDQHVFHNGSCVKPWETDGKCATCKPGEKRRAPNCHQYYHCTNDTQNPQLEWKHETCPHGHYFESTNQSCTISDGRCASVAECRDGDSYNPTCGDYILCVGGKFMIGNCPHLTRWDSKQRECVEDSKCRRYAEEQCRNGDVIPSYDCKTYQICRHGNFVQEQCFNGKIFVEPCRECENKFAPCHARYEHENYKPLICVHGEKIIDTNDCRRYVECILGEWYSMECPQGSFDPKTKSCVKSENRQCGYERLDQPTPPGEELPLHTIYLPPENRNLLQDFRIESAHIYAFMPQNYSSSHNQTDFVYEICDINSPQVVPHPYDCSKYKKCDPIRGYYTELKCYENEQFDWQQGKCRRWFQCKAPNCVEGMRLPKDECGKAKRCENGVWEDVKCKDEMAFINGRCSQTVSCKNASPTTLYQNKNNARCYHGDTKPHPKYCSRFYLCSYGESVEVECLNGQKYNPMSKRCDPQYDCPSAYQPKCYHGDTNPVDSKCDQYYSCIDGEFLLKFCPYGTVFNQDQRRCESGACQYNQNTNSESDIQNEPCQESPLPSGYRAHPNECSKFYQCAHGKWSLKTCPSNLAFNSALAVCDWPSNIPNC